MGDDLHRLEIEPVETWAEASGRLIARMIASIVAARGACVAAVAGDTHHLRALEELATWPLDWDRVTLIPTHDLLVPADNAGRLLPRLEAIFDALPVSWLTLPVESVLAVATPGASPGASPGARSEARAVAVAAVLSRFDRDLEGLAAAPPMVDLSILGVGPDGTIAGLRPGDPVLTELRRYSAVTAPHQGERLLTLTRPIFDRCRAAVWLVAGCDRSDPLGRMLMGDLSLPAGTIRPRESVIVADTDAARQV